VLIEQKPVLWSVKKGRKKVLSKNKEVSPPPSLPLPILTPWCGVLPEKLTGLQLVKKFPAFHGTQRFITALTSVRHLSLT